MRSGDVPSVEAIIICERAFRAKEGCGTQMELLVGEQKQDGVALVLDPARRRSLISLVVGSYSAPRRQRLNATARPVGGGCELHKAGSDRCRRGAAGA